MKTTNLHKTTLSLVLVAISASPAIAAGAKPASGDQILRAMSAKLAGTKQFTFHAHREIDPALLEGRGVAEKADVDVSVSHPSQIAARSVGHERVVHFIADGRTLTIYNETKKHYAQVPMRTSIDGLVAKLDEEYGFVPPLAEFAMNDPYREMHEQARTVKDMGQETVGAGFLGLGGVECHHLALKGKQADAELWVGVGDQLPRKLVATFHSPSSHPQVRVDFSSWNLSAQVPASEFTFTPPPGTQKIEMWTKARMEKALKH